MKRSWNKTITLVALSVLGTFEAAAAETDKPSVLMICIDDLHDWTGLLGGHPQTLTPQMDALAQRGRIFTNAHCTVLVCSASRLSVMSPVASTYLSEHPSPPLGVVKIPNVSSAHYLDYIA